jgi:hypothetical protein
MTIDREGLGPTGGPATPEGTQPYENTLTLEELRKEVRRLWDDLSALDDALIELPEVPNWRVQRLLINASMNFRSMDHDVWQIGKQLQRKHGYESVVGKTEYECAVGLWSLLRKGALSDD